MSTESVSPTNPGRDESKKLQTQARTGGMCLKGPDMRRAGIDACRHDAAIAHEQREVIRKLYAALEFSINAALTPSGVKAANAALTAAAPYLED